MTHDYRVPVDPRVKEVLNDWAKRIDSALPPGWGFALLLFTFGEGGTMTWISNAEREDMLKSLQEFIRAQGS